MTKRGGHRPGAGRPKGRTDLATADDKRSLEELARTYTETALNALVWVAMKSESDSARVSAASALLDRGYGKPRQAMEHTGKDGTPLNAGPAIIFTGAPQGASPPEAMDGSPHEGD